MVRNILFHHQNDTYVGTADLSENGNISDDNIYIIRRNRIGDYTSCEPCAFAYLHPKVQTGIEDAANEGNPDISGWLQIAGALLVSMGAALIAKNGGKCNAGIYTTEVADCQQARRIAGKMPDHSFISVLQMDYSRPLRPILNVRPPSNAVEVDVDQYLLTTVEIIEA